MKKTDRVFTLSIEIEFCAKSQEEALEFVKKVKGRVDEERARIIKITERVNC